jgi:AraC-like DNA-binding protein/mannose-6-phosphate isomerase-like protein (cupin superfamily)
MLPGRQPHKLRKCWRAPGNPEVVMFHTHHCQSFIAHTHDVLTVIAVTDGEVSIEIDETWHEVRTGQLVVIGAHQVHAARPVTEQGWKMRSVHLPSCRVFGEGVLDDLQRRAVALRRPVHRASTKAIGLFLSMHGSSEGDAGPNEQLDRHQEFMSWLCRNLHVFDPCMVQLAAADERLEQAKNLISKAAFNSTLIDDIAEEIGISSFALNRLFKRNFGLSPHEWRMQVRASEAAKLLTERVPLVDVAGMCGFTDQSHMGRIFKKVFGVTPGQYSLMQ